MSASASQPAGSRIVGPILKLDRARTHCAALEQAVRDFLGTEPFAVEKLEDTATGDLAYRLRIKTQVPAQLSVIVGDVVHNARAALDHLAWQAVEFGGGNPSKTTSFPIAKDLASFQAMSPVSLAGANSRTLALVRRLAPYAGGNDVLWRLHSLDVVDKHRLLFAVGAAYKHVVLTMSMPVPWQAAPVVFPPLALNPADRMFPLADGSELFRVNAQARGAPGSDDPQFAFEIAFAAGSIVAGEPLLPVLNQMIDHVDKTIAIFDRQVFRIP